MMPLTLFWGLIVIEKWGYRQMSNAMIDIMSADVPRVDYGKKKVSEADLKQFEEDNKCVGQKNKINLSNYIISGHGEFR